MPARAVQSVNQAVMRRKSSTGICAPVVQDEAGFRTRGDTSLNRILLESRLRQRTRLDVIKGKLSTVTARFSSAANVGLCCG